MLPFKKKILLHYSILSVLLLIHIWICKNLVTHMIHTYTYICICICIYVCVCIYIYMNGFCQSVISGNVHLVDNRYLVVAVSSCWSCFRILKVFGLFLVWKLFHFLYELFPRKYSLPTLFSHFVAGVNPLHSISPWLFSQWSLFRISPLCLQPLLSLLRPGFFLNMPFFVSFILFLNLRFHFIGLYQRTNGH